MFGSIDPDNPMGGLLGDLLKVIGSGSAGGGSDSWFEAARTLAFGVATDGGVDDNPDPLVRIAFEELARVAELHVADVTGITSPASHAGPATGPEEGPAGVSFDAVGPGQWSFKVLEAYRPVLKSMVEAQQQGAATVPTTMDLSELGDDDAGGLGGLLSQFAVDARAGVPRHAVRVGRRPPGAAGLRPVRATPAVARVDDPAARTLERGTLRRGLEPAPPRGPAVGLCPRAGHALGADPPGCALVALDAAGRCVGARRRGAALHRRAPRRRAWVTRPRSRTRSSDPEALLSDLITPEQRSLSGALTAQTTALGAYVDHVTARIAGVLTSAPGRARGGLVPLPDRGGQGRAGLRGALRPRRRTRRGGPWPRLRPGRGRAQGSDALSRLWTDELNLPTPAEVDAPGLWLARIGLLD